MICAVIISAVSDCHVAQLTINGRDGRFQMLGRVDSVNMLTWHFLHSAVSVEKYTGLRSIVFFSLSYQTAADVLSSMH